MAKKTTKATTRTSKTQSAEDQAQTSRTRKSKQDNEQGPPIEHYHGERTSDHNTDQGDLDDETLDRIAPYNKTYGRTEE